MKHWLCCLIFFLPTTTKLLAQFPVFNFSKINVEQGLSNRVVNTIYQDKTGFIWAGTNDGLNRLDGYRVKQFYYGANANGSIPNNTIHQITGKENMLVSTESGIVFLHGQQQFSLIKNNIGLSRVFNAKLFDEDMGTWICTNDSLFLYKDGQAECWPIKLPGNLINSKQKTVSSIAGITKDAAGNYWGWKDDFLFQLSMKEKRVLHVFTIGTHAHEGINFVQPDPGDRQALWIGTWGNGLFKFNISNLSSQLIALDNNVVHDIANYKDVFGKEWLVAATDMGIALIHPTSYILKLYNIGECLSTLVDKQNNLWLGTANGIFYVEPQKQWFNTVHLSTTIPLFKRAAKLHMPGSLSFVNGKYYAGLIYGKGMAIYNADWQLGKYISTLLPGNKSNFFKDIKQAFTYNNAFWFSCDSGLVKCNSNYAVQKIVAPAYIPGATRASYFKMKKLLQVNDSLLLIKSPTAIHVFNIRTECFEKTFTHLNGNNQSLPDIYFSDMAFINNNCFVTTDDGLLQLDCATGKWHWVHQSFANNRMQCIAAQDSLLWIGTQTGLSCFNTNNQQHNNYYRSNGLSSDNVLNICTDNKQRVWLSTTNGLTCFEKSSNNFTRIYKENGLPENALEGLLYADDKGKIFVGSIDAITWFYADKVLQKNQTIQAVINEVFSNNQPVNWQLQQKEKYIEAGYNNNNISLHFALLNYNNTALNKYYYLLEGADTAWYESSSGFLQFSNLKSGKYKLYVSSAPTKNDAMDMLYINIQYPFYQTWWFVILMLLMAVAILFVIYRIKAKALQEKILLQKNYNQQIKEAEMQTLRSQMNPHFIFNTLNAINSYIVENKTEQASDYLVTFSKLVRNILENSRHESIPLDKELTALELYLQLEQVRLEQSFSYKIEVNKSIDTISLRVPPLIIQPFVENAIWHGLRNKNEHGNVWVSITQKNEQTLLITITDDGIGRAAASKLKANQINHKSYGIDITQTRINLLHLDNKIDIADRIVNNDIAGTIVELHLNIH